jgi:nitroreductase
MQTKDQSDTTPRQIDADDFPGNGNAREKLTFLLNYVVLAPSSHNTQPWKFSVADDTVKIFADKTRWLKVADPDQRELHLSLGCALENLLVAAEFYGYDHAVDYFPDSGNPDLAVKIGLTPGGKVSEFRPTALFEAIPERHTSHRVFESRDLPGSVRQNLKECCVEPGLALHLTSDPEIKRSVEGLVERGDALQFADPAWRAELGYWIGQGVFGSSWLLSKVGRLAVTYLNMSKGTAKKDTELLLSAPELAVISSEADDRRSQIRAGQVYERVNLMATVLGVQVQPMSQIVEIPELRAEVAKLLPNPDAFPQHAFRLGYAAKEKRRTPRRPLAEVLV